MKKQKPKHYIQVWIEGEKNLPKPGKYNVHYKQVGDDSLWLRDYNEEWKDHWIEHIDFYLQEVEHPELTDEEISKKLDSINFDTSKEREDAYDAIIWARDKLTNKPER